MIRKINGVPVSDYTVRRLREVDQSGRLAMGCSSCRNMTVDRLVAAGLLVMDVLYGYVVTDAGRALLAQEAGT